MLRFALAVLVLALAACAGAPPRAPGAPAAPAFELEGRIAVRAGERAFTSQLRWRQSAARDDVWLLAPLGQTVAHLEGTADGAVLTTAEQRRYRAATIESLAQSALGWALPVEPLRFWVLGDVAPGPVHFLERTAAGRLAVLEQDGWRVRFSYADAAPRPSRLDLEREGAEIRIVIDALRLAQAQP
jgi:outer membrane lipoprotein LolB